MKVVFYRLLLNRPKWVQKGDVSPNETILYSHLVSKSISRLDDVYSTLDCGKIDEERLDEYLNDCNRFIPLENISHYKLSKDLCMSKNTIINGMRKFMSKGIIREIDNEYMIFVFKGLYSHGYFELTNIDKLSGDTLILYSWLRDKSEKYNGIVDTYISIMANVFHKSIGGVMQMLRKIYNVGLAERLPDGKLKINQ